MSEIKTISKIKEGVKSIKFLKNENHDFMQSLRERVNQYFKENRKIKSGNTNMFLKTSFMFSLFLVPYFLIISEVSDSAWIFFLLWIVMGFGMAGIGLSVMHDANHGSYSGNSRVNGMLSYSLNLLGGNSYLWKIQHNFLHHAFTNIEDVDDDIHVPVFLRFSPHSKKYWIQRYQHIYVWFFYAISTLSWITTKNFIQFLRYKKRDLIKDKTEFRNELIKEIGWKIFYFSIFLVIPAIILQVPFGMILLAFISMHLVIGLTLSAIFQPAHVIDSSEFPLPDNEGNILKNWGIHQLLNTCDYSPKSRIFSWFIGGLNYQIEHHLFPNICHVHYSSISKLVKQTAADFGMPYYVQPTFMRALINHGKMLRYLGNHK